MTKIVEFIGSKNFFAFIIAGVLLQAGWFAVSARYPMAFDENYHFGIIKLFAEQWGPVFTNTPPDSGEFGALTREPSLLYHYLMSFPYRLLRLTTDNEKILVIMLRFINIGLFTGGVILFRRLLLRFNVSPALTHFILFCTLMIPVVPFLAGTINYDNLVFLLLPGLVGLALSCSKAISQHRVPSATYTALLVTGSMLASLVKYSLLPVVAAILVSLAFLLVWRRPLRPYASGLIGGWKQLSRTARLALIALLLVSTALFIERYGTNLLVYGRPAPDCAKVESIRHCQKYGPWVRNYTLRLVAASKNVDTSLSTFGPIWGEAMLFRLFFAVNHDYTSRPPLPVPLYTAYTVALVGSLLAILFFRPIIAADRQRLLALAVIVLYTGALFVQNLSDFRAYREPIALNGRYLLPFLPLILMFVGLAVREALNSRLFALPRYSLTLKTILVAAVVFASTQGGGWLTFLIRAEDSWYWPGGITATNARLKRAVAPFIQGKDYDRMVK